MDCEHVLLRDGKLKLDKAGDAHCWNCDEDMMGDDEHEFEYGLEWWEIIAPVTVALLAFGALGFAMYQLAT